MNREQRRQEKKSKRLRGPGFTRRYASPRYYRLHKGEKSREKDLQARLTELLQKMSPYMDQLKEATDSFEDPVVGEDVPFAEPVIDFPVSAEDVQPTKNPHLGSSFKDFLKEEGIEDEIPTLEVEAPRNEWSDTQRPNLSFLKEKLSTSNAKEAIEMVKAGAFDKVLDEIKEAEIHGRNRVTILRALNARKVMGA